MSVVEAMGRGPGADGPFPRGVGLGSSVDDGGDDQGTGGRGRSDDRRLGGPRLSTAIGAILALVAFIVGSRVISDNSFLTHLATGQLIIEQGSVPTVDPYSYLASGQPWTIQSWFASLLYAALDATLGGWSIRVLHGGLAAAMALGLWRLTARIEQLIFRTGLVGIVILIGTYLWTPRPLLVGLACLVAVLLVAQRHCSRWWLLPVFWLWVNSHGSFVLGLVLLGAIMVGAALDERRLPRQDLTTFGVAVVGCLVAMANPLGWRLLWFPFHLLGRGEALDGVVEWASPNFRSPVEQLFLVLLILLVFAAKRDAPWRAMVPAIVFVVAGLLAVRNLGIASIVLVALLAPYLGDLPGTIDGKQRGRAARLLTTGATLCLALAACFVALSGPVDLSDYPGEEVDWLEARSLIATDGVRVAQRDFVGNYLTARYGSEARVFMDDRFDFYPQAVIDDHNALLLGGDFAAIIARNEFDVILWATESPLRRWVDVDPGWNVALDGESWFVACRTDGPVYDRCVP